MYGTRVRVSHNKKLSRAMTEILAHVQVAERATRDRKYAVQKHIDKDARAVADYVLVAEHRNSSTSKLQVKWKGPRRVTRVESD
jgi:hypothetical protein